MAPRYPRPWIWNLRMYTSVSKGALKVLLKKWHEGVCPDHQYGCDHKCPDRREQQNLATGGLWCGDFSKGGWREATGWSGVGMEPQAMEWWLPLMFEMASGQILPRASRRNMPCGHFAFILLTCENERESVCIVLSHQACGHVLQQQQQSNTGTLTGACTCVSS